MNSWAEISEHHLLANYRALTRATTNPAVPVLAVIKANAYGHSAHLVAPPLARAGAPFLGVTDAPEGARVRHALTSAGIPLAHHPEILIMCGPAPEDTAAILEHRLTPTLWTTDQLAPLAEAASAANTSLNVHLELDTGMSRQGAAPGRDLNRILAYLAATPHLHLSGVLTHLASAEDSLHPQTHDQIRTLHIALDAILAHRLRPTWLHVGNTSTLDNPDLLPAPDLTWLRSAAASIGAQPMLRSGLALYGHSLPLEPSTTPRIAPHLHPVLTWKTRIRALHNIPAGALIGYNATLRAQRPTRLALLPVGYADGLRRDLSSTDTQTGGWTILHGHKAPILGRISMNLTTVDVTDIPQASLGEEVTLLGAGITAEDHATLARTIPYEILCGLRPDAHIFTPSTPAVAHAQPPR